MISRDIVLTALAHKEPDRVPFDLGGMAQSGAHIEIHQGLREAFSLPRRETKCLNFITQAARFEKDLRDSMGIDTAIAYGHWADPERNIPTDEGDCLMQTDEWGITRQKNKHSGKYFDLCAAPFNCDDWAGKALQYNWPDPLAPWRFDGLRGGGPTPEQGGVDL